MRGVSLGALCMLVLLGLGSACDSPTQVLVRLVAGPEATERARSLRVRVLSGEGETVYDETRSTDGAPALALPATLPVVPGEGRAQRGFGVIAALFDSDGALLGEQEVQSVHDPGERREIWLCFADSCVDVSCGSGQRCVFGACVSSTVEAQPIGRVDARTACGPGAVDGGVEVDGGAVSDSGVDGGDASTCECPCETDTCAAGPCEPSMVIEKVASGVSHACAIARDASLWCWGANFDGQLGLGDTRPRRTPTRVAALPAVHAVSLGSSHSCAIAADGTLWCWGANGSHRLGLPDTGKPVLIPTQVGADLDWTDITAGGAHTCGLRSDDVIYCWGDNGDGQLGTGEMVPASSVPGPVSQTWRDVAAGDRHTCAVHHENRRLYCWGEYTNSRLADSDDMNRLTEDQDVPRLSRLAVTHTQVALGRSHGCGRQTTGELRCWGLNLQGQVGLGTSWARVNHQMLVSGEYTDWDLVTAGGTHTCGIRSTEGDERMLFCWGDNSSTQLGVGDMRPHSSSPLRVAGTGWVDLAGGGDHTCAVRDDGTLHCWGANDAGQLGLDDAVARDQPTRVCFPESP